MLNKSSRYVFWMSVLLCYPLYFWIWSIGENLRANDFKRKRIWKFLFKLSVIYPVVYSIFGIYMMIAKSLVIYGLHYAAMFSTFYAMIYAAKSLKSAELNKDANISEYLGDFFLIWFFPIGVWILQPRIHTIIKKQNKNTTA